MFIVKKLTQVLVLALGLSAILPVNNMQAMQAPAQQSHCVKATKRVVGITLAVAPLIMTYWMYQDPVGCTKALSDGVLAIQSALYLLLTAPLSGNNPVSNSVNAYISLYGVGGLIDSVIKYIVPVGVGTYAYYNFIYKRFFR